MNRTEIIPVIRNGIKLYDPDNNRFVYEKGDICKREFIVYYDTPHDLKVAEEFIGFRCYRNFHDLGQIENYLPEVGGVGFIKTPKDVLSVIAAMRNMGMTGRLCVEVEYVQGYPIFFKDY